MSGSLLEIFERREDLAWVFQDFPFHPSFLSEKTFLSIKTKTSHLFSQLKALFPQTSKLFLSSNSMRHTLSPQIAKKHFSSKSHERHLRIKWNMFLHDPDWKSHHMKPCSVFQFLVEFSPPTHDFGCSSCLSSLWF